MMVRAFGMVTQDSFIALKGFCLNALEIVGRLLGLVKSHGSRKVQGSYKHLFRAPCERAEWYASCIVHFVEMRQAGSSAARQ